MKLLDLGELGICLKEENLDLFLKLKYLSSGCLMAKKALHKMVKCNSYPD